MTRIIRCPACAAVYAVNTAQIQAARGWLRCGKCQEAFNGAGLDVPVVPALLPLTPQEVFAKALEPVLAEPIDRVPLDDLLLREDRPDHVAAPDTVVSADLMAFSEALATFRPQLPPQDPTSSLPEKTGTSPMRLFLFAMAAVLSLLLLGQAFFMQRHAMAALWPNSLPVLESLCRPIHCQLKPLMNPKAVVIEGASFAQSGELFVLTWVLRNTGPMTVATTDLELSLLDSFNNPVVRRVFSPGETHAPERLSPGEAWFGSLTVRVDSGVTFSQYRLLSFHP